jgi:hypothetical protein
MADDPVSASSIIKDINALVQTAAIIVGGIWAYLKFAKGRTFRPRLEPTISGKTFINDGYIYLFVKTMLKNVGGSRVDIEQEGTGLRILTASTDEPETVLSSDWQSTASFDVFKDHEWIEPGETISEERLIAIKKDHWIALRLELQIHSKKVVWHAMTIVGLDDNVVNPTRDKRP